MAVYRDKSNGKWICQVRYKTRNGETVRKTRRGFDTKREGLQWEREFLQKQTGSLDMTFELFVEKYEEETAVRTKMSTYVTKKIIIRTKILPYFGKMRINEITTTDVMQWQNQIIGYRDANGNNKYTKSYLKTIHNQLSAIFNHAVRYYGLSENPARTAGKMGSEKDIRMKFWTLKEYQKFSESMMDKPISYYIFQVLYWGGLRLGEMLALTPRDINFMTKTISINKTYYRIKGVDYITDPKTPKSVRTILIPDFLAEELEEYLGLSINKEPDQRMFNVSKDYVQHEMKRGIKEQGLERIRVHDLRHSHVSLLIDMGYSAVSIAERMGHESITITYRYAHMFPSVQKDMANKLEILWEEANEQKK